MKNWLFISLIVFPFLLGAQQHANYTQYTFNRFALNPAVAGMKPCGDTQFGTRRQWIGFEEAPKITFLSYNTRINKDDKYPKNFHGIGFHAMNDNSGYTNTLYLKAAYAYHMKIWVNYHLSFGMFVGLQSFTQSYNSIRIPNKALDPAIDKEFEQNLIFPEISPGIFLYNRNLFAGFSFLQAYPAKIGVIGTGDNRLNTNYFLSAGYRFRGNKIDIVPSTMISFAPFADPTVDMTLTLDYEQKISLALGSKYLNSGYLALQMQLTRVFSVGYSYEYALSEIVNVAPSTHEIIIGISTCTTERKKTGFVCPAYQ